MPTPHYVLKQDPVWFIILPPADAIRFAGLDQPKPNQLAGFKSLVKKYNIPSAFLEERTNSVTHSFGVRSERDGAHCIA
jgi:hypothetical protein